MKVACGPAPTSPTRNRWFICTLISCTCRPNGRDSRRAHFERKARPTASKRMPPLAIAAHELRPGRLSRRVRRCRPRPRLQARHFGSSGGTDMPTPRSPTSWPKPGRRLAYFTGTSRQRTSSSENRSTKTRPEAGRSVSTRSISRASPIPRQGLTAQIRNRAIGCPSPDRLAPLRMTPPSSEQGREGRRIAGRNLQETAHGLYV
jgi:hypothetical protein